MGINEWFGASTSLHKVISTIFYQSWTCYFKEITNFQKALRVVDFFFKCVISNVVYFYSVRDVVVKYKLYEGLVFKWHNYQTFKLKIYTLSKIGTILLLHSISKGFLFLQKWLKQFDCMGTNQCVRPITMDEGQFLDCIALQTHIIVLLIDYLKLSISHKSDKISLKVLTFTIPGFWICSLNLSVALWNHSVSRD